MEEKKFRVIGLRRLSVTSAARVSIGLDLMNELPLLQTRNHVIVTAPSGGAPEKMTVMYTSVCTALDSRALFTYSSLSVRPLLFSKLVSLSRLEPEASCDLSLNRDNRPGQITNFGSHIRHCLIWRP